METKNLYLKGEIEMKEKVKCLFKKHKTKLFVIGGITVAVASVIIIGKHRKIFITEEGLHGLLKQTTINGVEKFTKEEVFKFIEKKEVFEYLIDDFGYGYAIWTVF